MIIGSCSDIIEKQKEECREIIEYTLPCGHTESIECSKASESSVPSCSQTVKVKLDCGHTVESLCGYKPICTATCEKPLECGHPCPEPVSFLLRLVQRIITCIRTYAVASVEPIMHCIVAVYAKQAVQSSLYVGITALKVAIILTDIV